MSCTTQPLLPTSEKSLLIKNTPDFWISIDLRESGFVAACVGIRSYTAHYARIVKDKTNILVRVSCGAKNYKARAGNYKEVENGYKSRRNAAF